MANRAYLYSVDQLGAWKRPDEAYYDSRWVIPLAWFFFYRPPDICMVDIRFRASTWQEVKFAADKDVALAAFQARQPLLLSVVGGRLATDAVTAFVNTVRGRPGRFLVMDPVEVLGGQSKDDAWHAGQFSHILGLLETGGSGPEAILQAVGTYIGAFDPDPVRFEGQVLGYTYW